MNLPASQGVVTIRRDMPRSPSRIGNGGDSSLGGLAGCASPLCEAAATKIKEAYSASAATAALSSSGVTGLSSTFASSST
jgi:hypothetical protein